METITRKQAGRIYAAIKAGSLDMDKAMVARMYDEADWGAPAGLANRDRRTTVANLIGALNDDALDDAQMFAEMLWGDPAKADAIAERLEAADATKDEAEAATEAETAQADAMLAEIGRIRGKNMVTVEMIGLDKARLIIDNNRKLLSAEDWQLVEAAGLAVTETATTEADADETAEADADTTATAETAEADDEAGEVPAWLIAQRAYLEDEAAEFKRYAAACKRQGVTVEREHSYREDGLLIGFWYTYTGKGGKAVAWCTARCIGGGRGGGRDNARVDRPNGPAITFKYPQRAKAKALAIAAGLEA